MPATVLCVQQNRAACDQYREILEADGFEVLVAPDGARAIATLTRHNPDFVLLDIDLPRQDGFEVLAEIRALRPDEVLPILLTCDGDVTTDFEQRASQLGAIGVVPSPIAGPELIARVEACVKGAPGASGKVQVYPNEGKLKQLPFPELVHTLHLGQLDGVLLIEHGKKKKAIEFRAGWPVSVKSNLVSECLGSYLVKTGQCTKEEINASVERMRSGGGLQGEILVAMEILDEDGVVAVLQDHALAKLFEIFSWPDGRFQVRSGVSIQKGTSIALAGHPSNLILDGVRKQTPLKWVDRYLDRHASKFLVPCEGPGEGMQAIELAEDERAWIDALDGSLPVGAVLEEAESIRRLVFGLVSVDLLRARSAAGDPDSVRAARLAVFQNQEAQRPNRVAEDHMRTELAEMANRMRGADHYAVLDVSFEASDDEIVAARDALIKRAHPDRFHGASGSVRQLASQVFGRINEAYEGVADEEARAAYANEQTQGQHALGVEEEGRRALQAETEFQKGEKLMTQRDYEGALLCFGRAMENFPSEGEYRAHYGWCLYLCHPDNAVMLGEALEHCREGVKLAKDREKPYLLLGRLYKAMGKPGAAKKMFTRAVQIKPQCVEAMRELRIMNMRRDKDKGVLKRIFRR